MPPEPPMRHAALLVAVLAHSTCAQAATDPREIEAGRQTAYERAVLDADARRLRDLGDSLTDEQRQASLACVQALKDADSVLDRKREEAHPSLRVELAEVKAMHRAFDGCLAGAQLPVAHPVDESR